MVELRVGPLVRAVNASSAVIWAELAQPCLVTLRAQLQASPGEQVTTSARTTQVGGRFFVALQLKGLQPSAWYNYVFTTGDDEDSQVDLPIAAAFQQCFRTFDAGEQSTTAVPQALRIAYGSCRKAIQPETDALVGFGDWLMRNFEQREQVWPHLLLLIGDQIYADEPSEELRRCAPQLGAEARTFADFASMYEYSWTKNAQVRQALAVVPTYMIFDDHEVTNNWNNDPMWRVEKLRAGMEQVLIDGLVAYWVYQGWGNLDDRDGQVTPLLDIMHRCAQSGEDALEALRARIKPDVYHEATLRWHYKIASHPPIFVANARTERSTSSTNRPDEVYAPMHIMSHLQMNELRVWLQTQTSNVPIVVSSVPAILPPVIGLAEFVMGQRPGFSRPRLHALSLALARVQHKLASKNSFDHWPLYAESWRDLVQTFVELDKDMLVLSGDVHFSYAMVARRPFKGAAQRLYQFVSTPLQNALDAKSRRKIDLQAHISQWIYGGLQTHMLPLEAVSKRVNARNNLLFANALALVTLQPVAGSQKHYTLAHEYLGYHEGQFTVIGHTIVRH